MVRRWLPGLLLILVFALAVWASDRITLQGERTIFIVNCRDGVWQGAHCTGTLVPGERHAFRSSVTRQEVFFWIRGSKEPSGIYAECKVQDRDNWSCRPRDGQKPAITAEMKSGRPVRDRTLPAQYHDVPKWKWWLLELGFPLFSDADS